MTKKRATLADIAKQTNLSAITISRAFSHPDKVNPQTLEIILKAANELNYIPNRAARALKSFKSKIIGIVNPNMSNPFFGQITKEMVMKCQEFGYDVLMFDSYEMAEFEEKAIHNLIEFSVDGIILTTISSDLDYRPNYMKELKSRGIPVVLLDREIDGDHPGVYIDNLDSAYQIGQYIAKRHNKTQQIDIIAASDISTVSNNRVAGFRAALYDYNIRVHNADFEMNLAYQKAYYLLKENKQDRVFVGINNQITLGIIKAIISHGLRPQEDVMIYSIDDVPYSDIFGIKIPCMTHNLSEMSFQAVNSIIRLINGEQINDNKVIIRGTLNTQEH